METDIEVMLPQTKEHQKPSEDGRGKETFFPRDSGGSMALPIPRYQTSDLLNCEVINPAALSRLV